MGIGRDQEIAPTEEGGFLSNKSRDREIAPTEERFMPGQRVRKIDHKLTVYGTGY